MSSPPPAAITGLHLGEFIPPLIATVAYLYLCSRRARRLARERRPIATWRIVSFATGVLLVASVQIGPLDTLADSVLVAHMIQHIVIGDIASLLIVLGLTGPVIQPLLHIRATRPLRTLAHPLLAVALWAVNLYASRNQCERLRVPGSHDAEVPFVERGDDLEPPSLRQGDDRRVHHPQRQIGILLHQLRDPRPVRVKHRLHHQLARGERADKGELGVSADPVAEQVADLGEHELRDQ